MEADYRGGVRPGRLWAEPGLQILLWMAGLPLLDGVFGTAAAGGTLRQPVTAAAFGCTVFSGAGCLSGALQIQGGMPRRLAAVGTVYAAVLCGAAIEAAGAGRLGAMLPAPLAAMVLAGVALDLGGLRAAPSAGPPPNPAMRLLWALRALCVPQVALAAGLAQAALRLTVREGAAAPALTAHPGAAAAALIPVLSGGALTLIGAGLGPLLAPAWEGPWPRRGGAVALLCIAAQMAGCPVPGWAPGLALAAGVALGLWRARGVRP